MREGRSCAGATATGGMLGEGQAEEAVEREGEESSRAWQASEQYIRLGEDVMMLDKGSCEGTCEGRRIITCHHAWVCHIEDSSLRQTWWTRENEKGSWRETRSERVFKVRVLNVRMTTSRHQIE